MPIAAHWFRFDNEVMLLENCLKMGHLTDFVFSFLRGERANNMNRTTKKSVNVKK